MWLLFKHKGLTIIIQHFRIFINIFLSPIQKIAHSYKFSWLSQWIKNVILPPRSEFKKSRYSDSIRNPSEVKSLRRVYPNHKFVLISVDASPEIRYERLKSRNRLGDSYSWEIFLEQEKLEESSKDPNKQQLLATIGKADFNVDNSESIEQLENQIKVILKKL